MANENYIMHEDLKQEVKELRKQVSEIKNILTDIQKTLKSNAKPSQRGNDIKLKK
jgi:hypothetical protein